MIVVTGASSNHGTSLIQLLKSARRWMPPNRVVVYDLGLAAWHRERIGALGFDLKPFRFEDYPAHFDIAVNAGEYAWKPAIVVEQMRRTDDLICWMDAGNVIRFPMWEIAAITRKTGLYSPGSSGTVGEWTHPGMFKALGIAPGQFADRQPLTGAIVAFDPRNPGSRRLAEDWLAGAMDKDVIAPEGSSRANHRQDQALLTLLAYRSGIIDRPSHRSPAVRIHRDVPESALPD